MTSESPELLKIEEASKLMRLRPSTLRDWILKKQIPYVKLGSRVFLRRSDIDDLISASVVPAAPSTLEAKVR